MNHHVGFAVFCFVVVTILAAAIPVGMFRITWSEGAIMGEMVGLFVFVQYVIWNETRTQN